MALKRAFRLCNNQDFQRVRQQGRVYASRLLILTCSPNQLTTNRIGFVVSKRVSKRAVDRNYVKRLLAEAIRPVLDALPAGWDIVISAKNPITKVELPVLVQEIQFQLRRARLLVPSSSTQHEQEIRS